MKPPMDGMPAVWGIYFAIDDTDKTVEIAKANGGTVFQEPTDIPPGRMAVLADPAGAMFSRHQDGAAGTSAPTSVQRQVHEIRGPAALVFGTECSQRI